MKTLRLPVWIGAFGAVHHHKVGGKFGQFSVVRLDEHVLHEVCLPGHFGDKTYAQTGIGIGTTERIHHKQALAGKLAGDAAFQRVPGLLRQGLIVVFAGALVVPPQGIARGVVTHNVLILWRSPGENPGVYCNRAALRQGATSKTFEVRARLFLK